MAPTPSSSKVKVGDASGTDDRELTTMPTGPFNPEEMKELLIVAPVVALYSPIVLLLAFVTKISARLVTGMRQSAAATAAKRSGAKARESGPESDLVFVFKGLNLKILNEGLVFMGLVLCGVFYRNSQSSLPVRVALSGV